MAVELKVPSLGMDMEEAHIIRWLVEEGAEVEKGEPVLEIDTDKTSFEIEAPAGGVIRNLQGNEGDAVPVGATLAQVAAPGEDVTSSSSASVDKGASRNAHRLSEAAPLETEAPAKGNGGKRAVRASPAARRAAAARELNLEDIPGSGPRGRVYLSDVLEADVRKESTREPEPAKPETQEPEFEPASRREPLSRVRRLGAERTARSFRETPHFYLTRDLDADRLVELKERLTRRMDPAPSITDLLALAVARTLKEHPRLNSRYVDGELEVHDQVNLGIAVATEAGLVAPVLRGADRLSLKELLVSVRDLVSRARTSSLRPEELSGGTFTLSNLGMLEIDTFDAIINAPEAAILAVGRVRVVPKWSGGEWLPQHVISGTLSVDHRAADGADGARFLMDLQVALTDWELLL